MVQNKEKIKKEEESNVERNKARRNACGKKKGEKSKRARNNASGVGDYNSTKLLVPRNGTK